MTEPTKEQIKEFWEWCGLEELAYFGRCFHYKDGSTWKALPIDLDTLFKHAVPKMLNFALSMMGHNDPSLIAYYVSLRSPDSLKKVYSAEHKDPALALFWAIWKVINEEKASKV